MLWLPLWFTVDIQICQWVSSHNYPGNWITESILVMVKVLDITHYLRLKNMYTILVAASASIFRWNGENGRSYHGRTTRSLKPSCGTPSRLVGIGQANNI